MKSIVVLVKNIDEYRKAVLILSTYNLNIHSGLPCNEPRAISCFEYNKFIYIFINSQGDLGFVSNNSHVSKQYKQIKYEDLIKDY